MRNVPANAAKSAAAIIVEIIPWIIRRVLSLGWLSIHLKRRKGDHFAGFLAGTFSDALPIWEESLATVINLSTGF
jgi:hypothetical protein